MCRSHGYTTRLTPWRARAGGSAVVRVDNFQIDYREDGSERQFQSDLSVLDAGTGRTLSSQHISVNKPLRWGGCLNISPSAAILLNFLLVGLSSNLQHKHRLPMRMVNVRRRLRHAHGMGKAQACHSHAC